MNNERVETIDSTAEGRNDHQQNVLSLEDLFSHRSPHRVPSKTVLFREGELPDGVYAIRSGEIELRHERRDGSTVGRTARPGEVIGLSAVISGCSHLSAAVARTPCEFVFIGRQEFRFLIHHHPAIWFGVLRQLSQNLNESYDVIRRRPARRTRSLQRRF